MHNVSVLDVPTRSRLGPKIRPRALSSRGPEPPNNTAESSTNVTDVAKKLVGDKKKCYQSSQKANRLPRLPLFRCRAGLVCHGVVRFSVALRRNNRRGLK